MSRRSLKRPVVAWAGALSLAVALFGCEAEPTDPILADCQAVCAHNRACWDENVDEVEVSYDEVGLCERSCRRDYDILTPEYGEDCRKAFKDFLECLAPLTCAEHREYLDKGTESEPCSRYIIDYYGLCPGVFLAPGSLPDEDS